MEWYTLDLCISWCVKFGSVQFSHSVQFSSVAQSCPTLCKPMNCIMSNSLWPYESQNARPPCPSPTPRVYPNSCPSSQWCHPAILSSVLFLLPPIPPSIRVFSNESTLHMRWPKYWNFSFSISPSNEHPGLISFRMDWLDLLVTSPPKNSHTVIELRLMLCMLKHLEAKCTCVQLDFCKLFWNASK